MKRFGLLLALAAALFAAGCVGAPAVAPLPGDVSITILHTNDIHSRAAASGAQLGYARIGAIVNKVKAEAWNTYVIDVGDTLHGLPIANLEKGASITRLMNAVGYNYMTVGNHDFNYGQERLLELEKQLNFPILAANVYKNGKRVFKAYEIRDIQGVRVAFFGLASPETSYKTDPKGIEGITFTDPIEESKKVLAEIGNKADLVVCISHIGTDKSSNPTSIQLAAAVPGIHLILDGHSHTKLEAIQAENKTSTLITSTGEYGSAVGRVDIVIAADRSVASMKAALITAETYAGLQPDPKVKAIYDEIVAGQAGVLDEKVGETAVELVGVRNVVRTSQSNLGTLIAASMLDLTGADLVLMNGGGIRDSIPAGPITMRQIVTVMPFGNYPQTREVSGSVIKAALENGVSMLPAPDGRFPHVAGVTFDIDVSQPAGSRVSNVKIKGVALDPAKTYVLATLSYLFNGGDGYTMLVDKKLLSEYPTDAEVLLRYIKKLGVITADKF